MAVAGKRNEGARGARGLARWGVTRADVVFAALTLVCAAAVAARQWGGAGRSAGSGQDAPAQAGGPYAVVQNTEGFREALPLGQDVSVTVTSSRGTNVVEVSGGRVRVSSSDCANQVCVDAGWVSEAGQTITCLPHQLVVQVVDDPSDATPLS